MIFRSEQGDWLVVEMKRGRGSTDDLSQLSGYLENARSELASGRESVYGVLCCFGADPDARVVARERADLEISS